MIEMEYPKLNLSLEQQFVRANFVNQVNQMSREQVIDFLVEFYDNHVYMEKVYKDMLKRYWFSDLNKVDK
jgi:hypothetical protein